MFRALSSYIDNSSNIVQIPSQIKRYHTLRFSVGCQLYQILSGVMALPDVISVNHFGSYICNNC